MIGHPSRARLRARGGACAEGVGGDDRGPRGRRPGADRPQGRHRREALRAAAPALLPLPHLRPPAPRAGEAGRRGRASPTRWPSATSPRACRWRPTPSCTRPTRSPTPRRSTRSTPSTSCRPTTPRERLRWRRDPPAVGRGAAGLDRARRRPCSRSAPSTAGCVSWVELPEAIGRPPSGVVPALSDEDFARAAADVEAALAAAGVGA